MATKPRPLTRAEWLATSNINRGGWTYSKYKRWWTKSVGPKYKPAAAPTYDPLAPLSEQALLNIATRQANASLGPDRTELERLRKETAAQYAARAADIKGFGLAGAESLKSIGPQIQAGYSGAAGETAAFAKGFADANTSLAAASGQGANELMAAVNPNAPAGQGGAITAAAGAGALGGGQAGAALHDVIYAQGEIPAAGLAREGAAFGAAAGFLPGKMLGLTNAELMKSLSEGSAADKEFSDKLTELEKSRPDLVAKILDSLRSNELQKQATWINRQYLGIKQQTVKADAKTTAAKAGLDAAEVDETLSASNGYLTNKYGRPILDANGNKTPYTKYVAPPKAPKPGTGPKAKFNDKLATRVTQMYDDVTLHFRKSRPATLKDKQRVGDPTLKTVTENRYTYKQAHDLLWNKYGKGLMGYATASNKNWYRSQIEAAIAGALAQIGMHKPKPKANPNKRYGPGSRNRPG